MAVTIRRSRLRVESSCKSGKQTWASCASTPLVVELDGTLINTNLLWEMANQFIARHPCRAGAF
jgi:hypothetical protein